MTALAYLDELAWRGLLYQYTEGVEAMLASGPIVAYCGFDPTARSLHVGKTVLSKDFRCGRRQRLVPLHESSIEIEGDRID